MKSKNKKKWFPGKPGPAPTGLSREIQFLAMFSADEWEHLERLEVQSKLEGKRKKKAQLIRERVFVTGELDRLRREQGANIG